MASKERKTDFYYRALLCLVKYPELWNRTYPDYESCYKVLCREGVYSKNTIKADAYPSIAKMTILLKTMKEKFAISDTENPANP